MLDDGTGVGPRRTELPKAHQTSRPHDRAGQGAARGNPLHVQRILHLSTQWQGFLSPDRWPSTRLPDRQGKFESVLRGWHSHSQGLLSDQTEICRGIRLLFHPLWRPLLNGDHCIRITLCPVHYFALAILMTVTIFTFGLVISRQHHGSAVAPPGQGSSR